jgi:Bacterial Ig-like domain (group 3)
MRDIRDTLMTEKFWLSPLLLVMTTSMWASTQASITQLIGPAPTTTALARPTGSLFVSTAQPLTIAVTSNNGLVVPGGSVTLTDNSNVIGTAPVSNGTATFAQESYSAGNHQLIACYQGASNFSASCSAPLNVSALAPYLLEQTKPSATIDAPKVFVDDLQVIPAEGFSGVVQLACQVSSYNCTLSPSLVSFPGDGKTQIVRASFSSAATSNAAALPGLMILGLVGILIRKRRGRIGKAQLLFSSTALLCFLGCGPLISVPVSSATQTMLVNSTSGSYSQAVTYRIQVISDVTQ